MPAGNIDEVRAAFELLVRADLGGCGFRELDVMRGAAQRVRGFVAAVDVRVARRHDELVESWSEPRPDGSMGSGGSGDAGAGPGDANAGGSPAGGHHGSGAASTGDTGGTSCGGGGGGGGLGADDRASFGSTSDRRSDAEVARDRGRSRVCGAMPALEAALAAGRIDVAHLDAVVAAMSRIEIDEVRVAFVARADELVGYASVERPERFRRRCNDMVLRLLRAHGVETSVRQRAAANSRSWWDRTSGMFHLHLEVEPELGAKLETAIDQSVAARRDRGVPETFQRRRVEAIAELMLASSALDLRQPEVVVLVDLDTLTTALPADTGVCESTGGGALSPDTVRRLACAAGIVPVVMGGDGVPVDVGRKERTATTAQRRALRAMYRTCAHPTCDRPFTWCRMHHIVFWDHGGPTDLDHLLPLCDEHHHQVHEGGWTLTMTPDRTCTWITPSGVAWFHGDTRDGVTRSTRSTRSTGTIETIGSTGSTGSTGSGDHRRLHGDDHHPHQSAGRRPAGIPLDAPFGVANPDRRTTDPPTDSLSDAAGTRSDTRQRSVDHANARHTSTITTDAPPSAP